MIDSVALSAYRETKNHLHQPCSYYLLQDEVPPSARARGCLEAGRGCFGSRSLLGGGCGAIMSMEPGRVTLGGDP